MSTMSEIVARSHRDVGYVLFIEGLPYGFTDRAELAGTGAGSWIVGAPGGTRTIYEGLKVPDTISFATSMEHGMLSSEDGASFEIIDYEGKLIALVADNPGDDLFETYGPKDDPLPATTLDGLTALWGRWVNHEAIGPAGERGRYPCLPLNTPTGYDHAAMSGDAQTLAPSIVRDAPTWHEGLRCALYLIYFDTTVASDQPISDRVPDWEHQYASGYSLVWFGSARELTCEAITWTLDCDGPTGWLRRQIGGNRSTQWVPCSTPTKLDTTDGSREDLAGYFFCYRSGAPSFAFERGASSYYDTTNDILPAAGVAADYMAAIQARLNTVAATVGPDLIWSTARNASCKFTAGKITLQVDNVGYAAYAYVCLHESVWRVLGYDPRYQAGALPGNNELVIDFVTAEDLKFELSGFSAVPSQNYFVAKLSTIPKQYASVYDAGSDADNGGGTRVYRAATGEDASTIYPKGGQEVYLGATGGFPYFEGQTCRPPPKHTFSNGGGDVDTSAFIAIRGTFRNDGDDDASVLAVTARVGFKDDPTFSGHGPSADTDGNLQLYVDRFIDSRYFGIVNTRKDGTGGFDGPKSATDLELCPINFMGYNMDNGDRADLILLRTMLSTGTGYWTGYEGEGAVLTPGDNEHPDVLLAGNDVEIADLGLAIPYSLIDADSFADTVAQLPGGGGNSGLARCKFAFFGSFDSQELVARILEPRGWGMGLVRGQFRLFTRAQLLDIDDAEVTIEPDDFAVDDQQFVERADLRPMIPRDRFELEYGAALLEGAGERPELREVATAIDPQTRSRRTNNVETINGYGLVPTKLWPSNQGPKPWMGDWVTLAGRDLATHYAAPWVLIEVPIHWSKARDLGPGVIVRFTSLYAPSRAGTYGIAGRLGRVVKWSLRTAELVADVTFLVQAGDPTTTPPRFGPIAQVVEDVTEVEDRHDAATRTFYCYADAFGHGEPQHDVTWFGEPGWSGTGTEAIVIGWQWDGRTWSATFRFTVESVSEVKDSITWKAGSFTGTWWEARPTTLVLAPYDEQAVGSWPRLLFGTITNADGYFGVGPTKGAKLQ